MGGIVRYVEAMEPDEVFIATFTLSFVGMTILEKGKENMRGKGWAYVVIDRIGGRHLCCFIYIPVFTVG